MATSVVNFNDVHAVAGSSKIKATTCGHIYNIVAAANIDNGSIVGKGDYISAEKYEEGTATTFTGKIVEKAGNGNYYVEVESAENAYLVLTDPITGYDTPSALANVKYFYNAKGEIMRCYELVAGDIFELSAEGFSGTPAKGASVSVASKKVTVG